MLEATTVSPTTTAPELSSAAKLLGTEQTTDRTTTSDSKNQYVKLIHWPKKNIQSLIFILLLL